jgi:S1-C subfamily serine protease
MRPFMRQVGAVRCRGRWRAWLALAAGCCAVAACGGGSSGRSSTPARLNSEQLVAKARPATVKLFGRFGAATASGSGAVIDLQRGYVLTNDHVVAGVEALKAQTSTGQITPARVVARAPCEDVALVELPEHPGGLRAFPLGRSATVKAGQHVSVLGYPGRFPGSDTNFSFTDGTVSDPHTSADLGPSSPRYTEVIQHQAAVNHGNSGGPLVDDYGRLIGLNTLTGAGGGDQTQGQYYAIAIDRINRVLLRDLEAGRSVENLGWTLVPVSSEVLNSFYTRDLANSVTDFLNKTGETRGLMVLDTDPGSVAERNHFVQGDYITAINETPVTSLADVCEIVQSKGPGGPLRVTGRALSPTNTGNFGGQFTESMSVPSK